MTKPHEWIWVGINQKWSCNDCGALNGNPSTKRPEDFKALVGKTNFRYDCMEFKENTKEGNVIRIMSLMKVSDLTIEELTDRYRALQVRRVLEL